MIPFQADRVYYNSYCFHAKKENDWSEESIADVLNDYLCDFA